MISNTEMMYNCDLYSKMKIDGLEFHTERSNINHFGYFQISGEYWLWIDCLFSGKFSIMHIERIEVNGCYESKVTTTDFDTLDDALLFARLNYL